MEGNQWLKDLRSKADHYEEPEPEGLWQDILASSRRRAADLRRRTVRIVSSVAAVAAAVFISLYFMPRSLFTVLPEPDGNPVLVAEANQLPAPGSFLPEPEPGVPDSAKANSLLSGLSDERFLPQASGKGQGQSDDAIASKVTAGTEDVLPEDSGLSGENIPSSESGLTSAEVSRKEERRDRPDGVREEKDQDTDLYADRYGHIPDDIAGHAGRRQGISAEIYYSNVPGTLSRGTGFGSLVSSAALDMDQAMSVVHAGVVDGASLFAVEDQLSAEVRHRQPVRVGVAVRFPLAGRWGIETGLTYSLLESETDAGTSSRYFHTQRMLHYLGIPLKVTFDAVRKKHWSLYLSAGGMLEKNVAGKADVDFIVNGLNVSSRKEDVLVSELQWSLNAAAGIEGRLFPALGLYAEPGVSWFIDNGSRIETVYQSRPVNFNLEVGLRYHF